MISGLLDGYCCSTWVPLGKRMSPCCPSRVLPRQTGWRIIAILNPEKIESVVTSYRNSDKPVTFLSLRGLKQIRILRIFMMLCVIYVIFARSHVPENKPTPSWRNQKTPLQTGHMTTIRVCPVPRYPSTVKSMSGLAASATVPSSFLIHLQRPDCCTTTFQHDQRCGTHKPTIFTMFCSTGDDFGIPLSWLFNVI